MRNAMNIYKRKDGRFEGRIPLGYDNNGIIKYKYLYAKSLAEIKEKMLYAYADAGSPERVACDKTFKNLCEEWLASAKLRVKHSSLSVKVTSASIAAILRRKNRYLTAPLGCVIPGRK